MVIEVIRNGDGEIVERKIGRMSKYFKVVNFVNGRVQIQVQFYLIFNFGYYFLYCYDYGFIFFYRLFFFQVKGLGVGLFGIFKGGDFCFFMVLFLKGIIVIVIINGFVVNVGGVLYYKGEILFFVSFNLNRIRVISEGFVDILDVFNSFLEGFDQKSFIFVERVESVFLFFVGQDDYNWKSEFYVSEVFKRLQAYGKERFQIICYLGAGYYIEFFYFFMCSVFMYILVGRFVIWGGEFRVYVMVQVDVWKQLQVFFYKYLGGVKGIILVKL